MRLDKYLVDNGHFPSREKAQAAIKHQTVKVNGQVVTKSSMDISDAMEVEVIDIYNKYVSMGGLKLEKAIEDFGLPMSGLRILDIGASTGGFTDCALQHGASRVVAVDVGTRQLADTLRADSRVLSIENRDFRELTLEETGNEPFDMIVSDVSFISLTYILPYCQPFLKPDGRMVLLIKPQFEAGPSFLNKNGIVKDEKGYKIAIQKVVNEALNQHFHLNNLTVSTLAEVHKNVEFLALFSRQDNGYSLNLNQICADVKTLKKSMS
ncbi:MAG: TlyA family RNA methyltransferase [Bacteroidales bacterium]|nr:TlyA family RNA methyltransferase [Bacteroidales bacterium]